MWATRKQQKPREVSFQALGQTRNWGEQILSCIGNAPSLVEYTFLNNRWREVWKFLLKHDLLLMKMLCGEGIAWEVWSNQLAFYPSNNYWTTNKSQQGQCGREMNGQNTCCQALSSWLHGSRCSAHHSTKKKTWCHWVSCCNPILNYQLKNGIVWNLDIGSVFAGGKGNSQLLHVSIPLKLPVMTDENIEKVKTKLRVMLVPKNYVSTKHNAYY